MPLGKNQIEARDEHTRNCQQKPIGLFQRVRNFIRVLRHRERGLLYQELYDMLEALKWRNYHIKVVTQT